MIYWHYFMRTTAARVAACAACDSLDRDEFLGIDGFIAGDGIGLKVVAPAVGFRSSTAFTRAFAGRNRLTPTEWLRRTREADGA